MTPRQSPFGLAAATSAVALGVFVVLLLGNLGYLAATGPGRQPLRALFSPLLLSVTAASLATLFAAALGVPAAYFLARSRHPWTLILGLFLDLPLVLSPIVVGTAILLFLRQPPGSLLESLVGFTFRFPGVVLAQFTVVFALIVRTASAAFAQANPLWERHAALYGASRMFILTRVTLPTAKRGLLAALAMAFGRALGEFGATVTVAGTIPGRTETMATGVAMALASGELRMAAQLALVLVVTAGILLLFLRRWDRP